MRHFAIELSGEWHTVYRIPESSVLASVGCGLLEMSAQREADRLNALAELEETKVVPPPGDRPVIAAFYTNQGDLF